MWWLLLGRCLRPVRRFPRRRLLAVLTVVAALVAGAGAGFQAAEAAGVVPVRAIVTGSLLNVRSGPGTGFAVVDRVPEGTVVDLRAKQGGWFQVKTPRGITGWVAGEYLTAVLDGVRIVVDPGHGGIDGGAYANTLVEREVNLAIALPLRDILVARGAQVRMTREAREPNLPLWNRDNPYDPGTRTGMANSWPADMLISVHNNSSRNTSTRGLMAIWGNAPQSQALAQAIHDRVLYWTATRQGFDHVSAGQGVYRDTAIRGTTLAITNRSLVPATIVEVAFVSNPQDAALLKNPAFLQAVAKGIADGAGAFLLNRLPDGPIQPAPEAPPAGGGDNGSGTTPPPGDGGSTPPDGGTTPGSGDGSSPPPGDGTPAPENGGGTPGNGNPGGQTPEAPGPGQSPPAAPDEPQQPGPPGPPAPVPPFPDVTGTLAPEVHRARQLGLVDGSADGRFYPQRAVTRAEFAKMVVRAVEVARGSSLPQPAPASFRDVKADMALYEFIAKAAAQGYVLGYPDQTFRPDEPITREQAAAILQRVAGLRSGRATFPDVPDDNQFAPAVAAVAEAKLMRGHTNGYFGFGEPLQRAEAASVAVRLHDFLKK